MPGRPGKTTPTSVWAVDGPARRERGDVLATEEPLEIRLAIDGHRHQVAVTMRTPGADFELATGFLFGEGVLKRREQLRRITYCIDPDLDDDQRWNIVNVEFASGEAVDLAPLERHFSVTSACGVCGKATLDGLRHRGLNPVDDGGDIRPISQEVLLSLPGKLQAAQSIFHSTGGVHASGLFSPDGEALAVREDVGRHNAMDKLVGWAFLHDRVPLTDHLVMVSGRSSYELVQKAVAAGVSVLCSVSAPSSLAVQLAREFGVTLVGFLRGTTFKVYTGIERIDTVR